MYVYAIFEKKGDLDGCYVESIAKINVTKEEKYVHLYGIHCVDMHEI